VTAEIAVPAGGAEGVIIAQGGNIGGWALYAKGGKLRHELTPRVGLYTPLEPWVDKPGGLSLWIEGLKSA
jgi:hypothetical protein